MGIEGDAVTWHLPKSVLVHHSAFFKAALDGQFHEAAALKVALPDDRPHIFRYFVQWLYLGYFKLEGKDVKPVKPLISIFALGDKLFCPMLQDQAILRLIERYRSYCPGGDTIQLVYENTTPNSKLRQCIVAAFLQRLTKTGKEKSWFKIPNAQVFAEFSQDVATAMITKGCDYFKNSFDDPRSFLCGMTDEQVAHFRTLLKFGQLDGSSDEKA